MIRHIFRVEYADGEYIDIPTFQGVQEITQDTRGAYATVAGANYEYDLLNRSPNPKQNAQVRLSFLFVGEPHAINVDMDHLKARLVEGSQLKLWSRGDVLVPGDPDTIEDDDRWMVARIRAIPMDTVDTDSIGTKRVSVFLTGASDWRGTESIVDDPVSITTDPQLIEVTNPGTARIYDAVFRLSGTFDNPLIVNETNNHRMESTREGSSSDHVLRFNAGRPAVEWSTDGGDTWINDYGNFVRRKGQVQLMILEPGQNDITVNGVSSGTLNIEALPAWH